MADGGKLSAPHLLIKSDKPLCHVLPIYAGSMFVLEEDEIPFEVAIVMLMEKGQPWESVIKMTRERLNFTLEGLKFLNKDNGNG